MDITLTDEQDMIRAAAQDFAARALDPRRIRELENDERGFSPETWQQMVTMGWAGAPFPEAYGGTGLGMVELALVAEALGRGALPSPFFSTVVEAGMLLCEAGSDAQRSEWLPRIARGESIVTTAILEPGAELHQADVKARIVRSGEGYRVSGTKLFVRDAGVASAMVFLGRDDEAEDGLTMVLVPMDAAGVARRRLPAAGGESLWEVACDGVRVGEDARVGVAGAGWAHAERLIARGAVLKAAELVGIGQAALDLTVEYAKTRVQFGRPIGTFQAVQRHCAEMYRDVTISRLLAWQAAWLLAQGRVAPREVAMAKAKASECIPAVTRTAHQVHGAFGYYRDYPLELHYHRAYAAAATYGDARYHRRCLARMLREDMDAFRGEHRHELPVHCL